MMVEDGEGSPDRFEPLESSELVSPPSNSAVVINEDTVDAVGEKGNGDAKVAQKRPVKRRKSGSTDVIPRTQRNRTGTRRG